MAVAGDLGTVSGPEAQEEGRVGRIGDYTQNGVNNQISSFGGYCWVFLLLGGDSSH